MNFNLDLAIKLATMALSICAMVYAFFANRRKDVDVRFETGAKKMSEHDLRIGQLETTVRALPQVDEVHRLEMTLSEIGGDMKAMRATMKAMSESMTRTERIVGRHEDHLLQGATK